MINKQLRIQTKQAIDVATTVDNSENLLINTNANVLKDVPFINSEEVSESDITSLSECFGLDYRFYYKIDVFESKEAPSIICSELGTGHLVERDGNIYLNRASPVSFIEPNKDPVPISLPQSQITCSDKNNLILVTSVFPDNIFDCIGDPHSIVYSNDYFKANPLVVETNSLVGRLKDSITSISISYLVNEIIKKIKKSFKTKEIILESNSKPTEQEGVIIYDKDNHCLKFYNGKEWVSVS